MEIKDMDYVDEKVNNVDNLRMRDFKILIGRIILLEKNVKIASNGLPSVEELENIIIKKLNEPLTDVHKHIAQAINKRLRGCDGKEK